MPGSIEEGTGEAVFPWGELELLFKVDGELREGSKANCAYTALKDNAAK